MQADTVFDRLVMDLSREDRRRMLEKIGDLFSESLEPLADDETDTPMLDLERAFQRQGLLVKILIFLKTFFSGRSREDVLMERLLADVARDVNRRRPGLLDPARSLINSPFADELKALKGAVAVFIPALNRIAANQRAEFNAFLAGLEMEEIQSRLLEETDPRRIMEKFRSQTDSGFPGAGRNSMPSTTELTDLELKRMMENGLENVMQFLPGEGKAAMYRNMKLLHSLQTLATYPFDRVIGAFGSEPELSTSAAPIKRITDHVIRLAEIMHSLKGAPSRFLLQGMFLFLNEEKRGRAGYDPAEELDRQIKATNKALAKIRSLNKTFPFVPLARYVSGDINYVCADTGGGEDWFTLLRQFWRGRIDLLHQAFARERKRSELLEEIRRALEPAPFSDVGHYAVPDGDGRRPGTYRLTLGFLKTFFTLIFPPEFNRYLKVLLVEGEFYKGDNRQEFTEAYSLLLKAGENLELFENRFQPGGEFQKTLQSIEEDPLSDIVRKRKIETAMADMDREAESMIQDVRKGFTIVSKILGGILYGEIGGRYDTLSNLGYLGGRANRSFMKALDNIFRRSKTFGALVEKAFLVEGEGR